MEAMGEAGRDSAELEIHAMAPAPNGGLYVGTSPDGKIYQVSTAGTSTIFYDPEDKYIWALAVDRGGNVFAATGDKADANTSNTTSDPSSAQKSPAVRSAIRMPARTGPCPGRPVIDIRPPMPWAIWSTPGRPS